MIARSLAAMLLLIAPLVASGEVYDPLRVASAELPAPIDFTVTDEARQREIPIRVYLPANVASAPVVLFSHGLGGSRMNNPYLGRYWSARGYVVVFVQHPGSDESVWRDAPPGERLDAMRQAAGPGNFMLRVRDIPAVLDQLEKWNASNGHALSGRLELRQVGMSGHSFGAITTQAVSGQAFRQGDFTDARIRAAVMMSPSSPRVGSAKAAFSAVTIPWMLLTGSNDVAIIGDADVKSRLAVFPALPAGGKFELVLDGAEHSAFSERALPGDRQRRNPNHHRAILAVTTAFWDAYLREDPAAKAWLEGDGPRGVLEPADTWQRK